MTISVSRAESVPARLTEHNRLRSCLPEVCISPLRPRRHRCNHPIPCSSTVCVTLESTHSVGGIGRATLGASLHLFPGASYDIAIARLDSGTSPPGTCDGCGRADRVRRIHPRLHQG